MGSLLEVYCKNCDFRFIKGGADFFHMDFENDKLEEFMPLMMTRHDKIGRNIGQIEKTYCPDCDKIIKTYLIRESDYPIEESIRRLEAMIKKSKNINERKNIKTLKGFKEISQECDDNEFLEKFKWKRNILTRVEYEKYLMVSDFETVEECMKYEEEKEYTKINCPQCNKELYRNFIYQKCPICGNKLSIGFGAKID